MTLFRRILREADEQGADYIYGIEIDVWLNMESMFENGTLDDWYNYLERNHPASYRQVYNALNLAMEDAADGYGPRLGWKRQPVNRGLTFDDILAEMDDEDRREEERRIAEKNKPSNILPFLAGAVAGYAFVRSLNRKK
jgi:hypothetical protein